MDALAAASHHKRKGSALDQLLEGRDPVQAARSGKAARPNEGDAGQAEAEAPEGSELTQTCSLHLLQLRTSQEELLKKIDAITAAGTTFLDQLRAAFLQRMERVKGELGQLVDDAEDMLRVQSTATLDCCRRAEMASQLISKLNIKTVDAEQQRPDAIYSAQEEGGDAQEGQAVQGGDAAGSGVGH